MDTNLFYENYTLVNKINGYSVLPSLYFYNKELYSHENLYFDSKNININGYLINVADGDIRTAKTDYTMKTICMGFDLTRSYSTEYREVGLLGMLWRFHFEKDCKTNATKENIKKEHYPDGRLKAYVDIHKNRIEIKYHSGTKLVERLESSCGKALLFKYLDNKISCITDNLGQEIKYFYKGDFLALMEMPNGGKYRFFYINNMLSKVIDPNENIEFSCEYNRQNRVNRLYDYSGDYFDITFDERNKSLILKSSINNIVCKYDRNKNLMEIRLNGNSCFYIHNSLNGLLERTDVGGNKVLYEYEGNHLIKTSNGDKEEKFVYDEYGNLVKYNKSNGYEELNTYNSKNSLIEQKIRVDIGVFIKKAFEYDAKGRLIGYIDGNKNSIKHIYEKESSVNPDITIYPNGYREKYQWDDIGRLITINHSNNKTSFVYNSINKVVMEIKPDGSYYHKMYDLAGNLKDFVLPTENENVTNKQLMPKKFRFNYDERNRLVKIIKPSGDKIIASLNKISDINQEDIYKYNYCNWITEKWIYVDMQENGSKRYNYTKYEYDKNGNIIKTITQILPLELGETLLEPIMTILEYDSRNNLVHKHSNSSEDIRYFYIEKNKLQKETTKINKMTDKITFYTYNENGLLAEKIDLLDKNDAYIENKELSDIDYIQIITKYEYNKNGNVSKIILPNKEVKEFIYNCDGELIDEFSTEENEIKANIEQTVVRDKFGRVIKTIDKNSNTTIYEYDNAGNISSKSTQDYVIYYEYNSINKIKTITQNGIEEQFLYDESLNKYKV